MGFARLTPPLAIKSAGHHCQRKLGAWRLAHAMRWALGGAKAVASPKQNKKTKLRVRKPVLASLSKSQGLKSPNQGIPNQQLLDSIGKENPGKHTKYLQ